MKKLLTILTLALALCLLCSVALAADSIEITGDAYKDATQAVIAADAPATLNVVYNGNPETFNLVTNKSAFPCLETVSLRYEAKYSVDPKITLWFNVVYTVPHKIWNPISPWDVETCTEPSTEYWMCGACGEHFVTHWTPAKGHTWERKTPTWIDGIYEAPTCEEAGIYGRMCTECGALKPGSDQVIEAIGHEFDFYWVKEPTCKETGTAAYHCNYCGMEWDDYYPDGYTARKWRDDNVVKPVTTVKWTPAAAIANAALKAAGIVDHLEKNTSVHYLGHDFDAWVPAKAATCAKNATQERWCKICGEKQELEIPNTQLKKNYVMVSKVRNGACDEVVVTFRCSNCTKFHTTTHAPIVVTLHDMKTAKATNPSLTDEQWKDIGMLPDEVQKIEAHEYVFESKYRIGKIEPTCTEDGGIAYACRYEIETMGKTAGEGNDIEVVGNKVTGNAHPYALQNVRPALGHDWSKWIMEHAPKEAGNEYGVWVRTCQRCGETENRVSPYYPDDYDAGEADWVEVARVEATCTTDGSVTYKDSKYGAEKTEVIPALGHDWELVKETKAATCTAAGEGLYICKTCGTSKTEATEALGHKWDEGKVSKEATKEAKGDMTYTCTVCGETKVEEGVVDYVITAAPDYTITVASYSNPVVTGKVEHVEDTKEADELFIRVTFFMNGNYYMSTMAEVDAEGNFSIEGVGDIQYISIQARGTSSVKPGETDVYDAYEITF